MSRTKLLATMLSTFLVGTVVENASAYHYKHWCNGSPVKWDSPFIMMSDRCSMPEGSARASAYDNATFRWWYVSPVMNGGYTYDTGCTITTGNGYNQTAVVSPSAISGYLGLTTCIRSNCTWWFSHSEYEECDVRLSSALNYTPQDESFYQYSDSKQGQVVTVHEFGHVLGLDHSEGFDIMRAYVPYPLAGNNSSEPFPDDAMGGRNLYGGAHHNLFASAQKFENGSIMPTTGWVDEEHRLPRVCPGESVTVTVTVGNSSPSAHTSGFRIYLNNYPFPTSFGWNVFVGTAYNPANSYFTQDISITVPELSPGYYWIFWEIDTDDSVVETDEWDNTVHSYMVLNVQDCG